MKQKKYLVPAIIACSMTAGSAMAHAGEDHSKGNMHEAPKGQEKCFGIALKGKNDCATDKHSCAGKAESDYDDTEFRFVKKGLCEKIQQKLKEKKSGSKEG